MPEQRVAVRGSERRSMPNAQAIGVADPKSVTTVTILLRRRNAKLPNPGSETMTREEFADRFGADPADVPVIEAFASDNDLTVVEVDLARRSIVLSGTVADL